MGLRELPRHLQVDAPAAPKQLHLFAPRRTFAPYQDWEDYRAGMFHDAAPDARVADARAVLSDRMRCRLAMERVVCEWPTASAVNLTNPSSNRRAWLGQAACCLECGATSAATKRAWWQMSDLARAVANRIADEVISLWTQRRAA